MKSIWRNVTIWASLRPMAFEYREVCVRLDEFKVVHCWFVGLQYWCWSVQARAVIRWFWFGR